MKHEIIPLLTVDAKDLRRALMKVAKVISTWPKIPVLECARITAERGSMRLTSTDLDLELEVTLEAECFSSALDVLVRPRPILTFLSSVQGPVEITLDQDILEMRAGDRRLRMRLVIPVEDWPVFAWEPGGATIAFGEEELRAALTQAMIAVPNEETRYYLNGVHMRPAEGDTILETTDGHRLVRRLVRGKVWPFCNVILPKKSARTVIDQCARLGNGDVRILAHPRDQGLRALEFTGSDWRLRTKVIDGTFPDTARVTDSIEHDASVCFTLSLETLRGMRRTRDLGAAVDFYPDDGIAVYFDAAESIEITAPISGRGSPVSFNPGYLRDFCAAFGPLRLEHDGKRSPARLIAENPDVTLVVMPMRAGNGRLQAGGSK